MEALTGRLENKLRAAWVQAMRELKDLNGLPGLEARIAASDTAELIRGIDVATEAFTSDVAAGYVFAAQRAAKVIDGVVEQAFRFSITDPAAHEWMTGIANDLAASLVEEQQTVARMVVRDGIMRGLSERAIAEDVQGSIGLSPASLQQVWNYRATLEANDYARAARDYQLADGRYDAALVRADDAGTTIGPDRLDGIVDAYRNNWVKFRANGIALESAQEASHAGVRDAFGQAVDKGVFASGDVEREWHTVGDDRVRDSHADMAGQKRDLDTPFTSGAGVDLMYPGDPDAPAKETAGCRCSVAVRVRGFDFSKALASVSKTFREDGEAFRMPAAA